MVNLVKKSDDDWTVTYLIKDEQLFKKFSTIELAADFMVKELKVNDFQIDNALIEMAGLKRKRAIFNRSGELILTEKE